MKNKRVSNFELRKRLVKSLVVGIAFIASAAWAFTWVMSGADRQGLPVVLRKTVDLNEKFGRAIYSNNHLSAAKPAPNGGPRVNGDIGLQSGVDLETYRVNVESGDTKLSLKLDELKTIPFSETTTDFKCVEGWTEIFQYAGVRFSDFMKKYNVGRRPDGTVYPYVGLETPDGEYYVSLDSESMMHPQTLLVFEMNGQPLRLANGFPIRLIVPNKYGIKSLKRIGRIFFSDIRPPDFWNERGYDWFSGL